MAVPGGEGVCSETRTHAAQEHVAASPVLRLEQWLSRLDEIASDDDLARYESSLRVAERARDLGHATEALGYAQRAVAIARGQLTPAHEGAALGVLASVERSIGNLQSAEENLALALTLTRASGDRAIVAALIHEQGLLVGRRGDLDAARKHFQHAIDLELELGNQSAAFQSAVDLARLEPANQGDNDPPLAITLAYALGRGLESDASATTSWIALARIADAALQSAPSPSEVGTPSLGTISKAALDHALQTARASDDARNLAWALGTQAERLAEDGNDPAALGVAREATTHARRARDSEANLRFTSLVGRLEKRLDQRAQARAHLEEAVALWRTRQASMAVVPVEMREMGRALLFDLVDLLTSEARIAPDPDGKRVQSQALLTLAQDRLESLRTAELRDYFRDDCVDAYRERSKGAAQLSKDAAIIYPILFEDRLEILVSHGSEIHQFTVDVDAATLSESARALRRTLPDRILNAYKAPAKRLYDWLIRPIRPFLSERSIQTLVFVPGGALRLIPMASLFDGKRFLIESFSIATIPALELMDSHAIKPAANMAFLGGLAEAQGGFAPLAHVPRELAGVRATLGRGTLVLDEAFQKREIAHHLQSTEYNIVHIATHAQFGATSDETFLLAHDGRITMDELAEWVGAFRYRETPLDLIVLSACESAAGDEQAALGLSGIAVKAGAQSALGTLWSVNDDATATLIDSFYKGLIVDGLSRAEALRHAQLELLADPSFKHPFYWAPFLLINAWL